MMKFDKRDFLKLSAAGALLGPTILNQALAQGDILPRVSSAKPISRRERGARVQKVQALMQDAGIDALVIEPGSTMIYFSGLRWWRSERLTALVIPKEGYPSVVTPYFEEPSIRESLEIIADVRTWNENENPFEKIVGFLKDRGYSSPHVAIDPYSRYFVSQGLSAVFSSLEISMGDALVNGCRMFKTDAELALMQAANDITLAAYARTYPRIERGMLPNDVSALMNDATRSLGGTPEFSLALLNEASAYPHGTTQPQIVREGSIILMDCGCSFEDYQSDISRTFVFGEPTKKQRDVWQTVRRGQDIVMEAAQLGVAAGKVDDAVRGYYESLGYGPGYQTPGLSHRTGHGIGMDGHEPINLVQGETAKLQQRMCFSNEPGIYIFNEFGVRMEDCFYMTQNGPQYFSEPQSTIERPV
ncbi:MAG: Xaa-Pro peptidase family protein [Sphingomonadales bacterium]|jgi:Xaa-Pro dipeptidase